MHANVRELRATALFSPAESPYAMPIMKSRRCVAAQEGDNAAAVREPQLPCPLAAISYSLTVYSTVPSPSPSSPSAPPVPLFRAFAARDLARSPFTHPRPRPLASRWIPLCRALTARPAVYSSRPRRSTTATARCFPCSHPMKTHACVYPGRVGSVTCRSVCEDRCHDCQKSPLEN